MKKLHEGSRNTKKDVLFFGVVVKFIYFFLHLVIQYLIDPLQCKLCFFGVFSMFLYLFLF